MTDTDRLNGAITELLFEERKRNDPTNNTSFDLTEIYNRINISLDSGVSSGAMFRETA